MGYSRLVSRSLSVNLSLINFLGGSEKGVCDSRGVGHLGSLLGLPFPLQRQEERGCSRCSRLDQPVALSLSVTLELKEPAAPCVCPAAFLLSLASISLASAG